MHVCTNAIDKLYITLPVSFGPVGSDPAEFSRDPGNKCVIREFQLGIPSQILPTWNVAVEIQRRDSAARMYVGSTFMFSYITELS